MQVAAYRASNPCFNPLPPTRTGETRTGRDPSRRINGFNPLPPTRTGETSGPTYTRVPVPGFNPLPPTRTGETSSGGCFESNPPCFNPLPPTRTGETAFRQSPMSAPPVSIHSRPPGREKRCVRVHVTEAGVFQSTPAHQDGRNRGLGEGAAPTRSFNPLPPTRTGETAVLLYVSN